jgi:soluble lytic murein transglycosylase-like protein
MKSLIKVILITVFTLAVPSLLVVEHFKARMADTQGRMDKLDAQIVSQRVYNAQNTQRIALKARIASILSTYSRGSLHHDPVLLAEFILLKSGQYKLDPYLVLGMIMTESDFNSQAVSNKGALGLMQIRPGTASYLAPHLNSGRVMVDAMLVNDNELNIGLGTLYMARLIRQFGSLRLALEAYNRGPNGLSREISAGGYTEPNYSIKVIGNYRKLKFTHSHRQQYRG